MFSQYFKEFVELLIKHEVDYLIVGGYAAGIHGDEGRRQSQSCSPS